MFFRDDDAEPFSVWKNGEECKVVFVFPNVVARSFSFHNLTEDTSIRRVYRVHCWNTSGSSLSVVIRGSNCGLFKYLSMRSGVMPASSAPRTSVSTLSPMNTVSSGVFCSRSSAMIINAPVVLSSPSLYESVTVSNSFVRSCFSSTFSIACICVLATSPSVNPSFFSFSSEAIVSGYGFARSQFVFQIPMSFSTSAWFGGTLNSSSTSANASFKSAYSFVMKTVSKCSANCGNPILGLRRLYVCLSGLFVPCSTSVPQKSKRSVVIPAIPPRWEKEEFLKLSVWFWWYGFLSGRE